MIEVELISYDGPALIAGVELEDMRINEHAQGSGETVERRWWEATARGHGAGVAERLVAASRTADGCRVEVPGHGAAQARVGTVSWTGGGGWALELRGEGRAPLT